MHIAVAGSSGLGVVVGVSAAPTALLTGLPPSRPEHVLLLSPRHLERRSREQAHVVVAALPDVRVGVLAFDHHALTLTLIAAAVSELRDHPHGWAEPGEAVQLVEHAAARSRSVLWHPRLLGLRRPVPSLAQSVASLLRGGGYVTELAGAGGLVRSGAAGPIRGAAGFARDGAEAVYVTGDAPPVLLAQLGEAEIRAVKVTAEPDAPYRTRRSVELCGLAAPGWGPLVQEPCGVCSASRPPAGCLFCGTGAEGRTTPYATAYAAATA